MQEVKIRGGARIGRTNSTWPFARLKVTKDQLSLKVSITKRFFLSLEILHP